MKKILLIDDTRLFLELEKSFLKLSPVKVLTAGTGEEALAIARVEHPDLIFMDIHMPGMGGIACCTALKSDPELRSIPVVMVTSSGKEEDIEICREAGCDGYVTKPIDRRIFLDKARSFLGTIDRREHRVPYRVSVVCSLNGKAIIAESADISSGGIYVACSEGLRETAELSLTFTLEQPVTTAVSVRGRIAWVNSLPSLRKPSLPPGFGVEFLDIQKPAAAAVDSFMASHQSGS
jgi:CheY-like chemotaxis protein